MSEFGYAPVYRAFALPERALALAAGDVPVPRHLVRIPFRDVGFPPALVPIYSVDYPWLVGFWVDPFGHRATVVAEVVPEDGYRAHEYFRNFDQLSVFLVVHAIVGEDEDEVTPETRALADQLGVEFDPALALADAAGDEVVRFGAHPAFAVDPPFTVNPAGYRGDWPTRATTDWTSIGELELTAEGSQSLRDRAEVPPWFTTTRQPPVFEGLLSRGDHAGAWRCLNSSGWLFSDAKIALRELAAAARNDKLNALALAWCARPHETFGGYGSTDRTTWWGTSGRAS